MGLGLSGLRLGLGQRGGGGLRVNFYVDSVGGSDANDGLTDATAFQTLAAAETAALAYGDGVTVGLVAGSEWREDLDLSTLTSATVMGVGDLAGSGLPVVDGALVYSGSYDDATARGDGLTNVWSFEVTQTEAEGYQSIWADGQKLNWVASAAAVTPGDFYVSNVGTSNKNLAGTNTIYFRLVGDADPTGAVIEYTDPTRQGKLQIGTSGTAKYIHTTRNFHADGSIVGGHGSLAESCIVSEGVKHEGLLASGTWRSCAGWHTVSDARTNNISLEFYASSGVGWSCIYDACVVVGPGAGAAQLVAAYGGHNLGAGTYYDSISMTDCTAADCTEFGTLTVQDSASYARVWSHNCATGVGGTVASGTAISVIDAQYTVTEAISPVRGFAFGTQYELDGLRAYISSTTILNGIDFTAQDVTITNSAIVFNSADGFQNLFRVAALAGRTVSLTNTIFQNSANVTNLYEWYNPGDQVLGTRENNVYFDAVSGGTKIRATIDGTGYSSASAFLAAFPETGTVTTNPGLVDPANFDFSLTAPLANGAGLERFPTYTPIPASITAAEAWILS